jgi:hypothetical protein
MDGRCCPPGGCRRCAARRRDGWQRGSFCVGTVANVMLTTTGVCRVKFKWMGNENPKRWHCLGPGAIGGAAKNAGGALF